MKGIASFFLFLTTLPASFACTSIAVGRLATVDGSVIITQSSDGDGTDDSRIVAIPRRTYPAGSMRQIFPDNEDYPRFVGAGRGVPYEPLVGDDSSETKSIGEIPQVRETFAYWDAGYAVMNEHQVSIGESSCSASIMAPAAGPGVPDPLLPVDDPVH